MTDAEYDGRSVDRLVAKHVFGAEIIEDRGRYFEYGAEQTMGDLLCYSEDVDLALLVVERLREEGYVCEIDFPIKSHVDWGWTMPYACRFTRRNGDGGLLVRAGEAKSLALAICLAGLRAKGVDATAPLP